MAQIGRFIDGPYYGSLDFAEFFTNFLSTGFFMGLETESTGSMNVIVTPGSAFVEGYEYRNTEDLSLTHSVADTTNDRIDRVVVRLDRTPDADQYMTAMVRNGVANANPQPPELVRNETVYEISLAQVRIEAGKSYIEQYQITDERGNRDVCGRVGNPGILTDQINSVDVKTPATPARQYQEGTTDFYLHGDSHADVFQEWFDTLPVEPTDYASGGLSSLRAYVETTSRRNNTGIQTITIYHWAHEQEFRICGKFERATNALSDTLGWGRWQEHVLVVEEGSNSRGFYTMYSDGTMECYCTEPNSPEIQTSTGNMYRSETFEIQYPIQFTEIFSAARSVNCQGLSAWGDFTGAGDASSSNVRLFSGVTQGFNFTTNVWVKGRWRR